MAKLSAHGFELARVERTRDGSNSDGLFESERQQRSFRSDGHIMQRHITTFSIDHVHDYGWKLFLKLRAKNGHKLSKSEIIEIQKKLFLAHVRDGWEPKHNPNNWRTNDGTHNLS